MKIWSSEGHFGRIQTSQKNADAYAGNGNDGVAANDGEEKQLAPSKRSCCNGRPSICRDWENVLDL